MLNKFKNIKTLVLDMDDTMYPKSLKLGEQFVPRVVEYAKNTLHYNQDETSKFLDLWKQNEEDVIAYIDEKYGKDAIEPFMDYVCALDVSTIEYNPKLAEQLENFPIDIIVYTNTTHSHINDVLGDRLDVKKYLEKFHTTKEAGYIFKQNPKAFEIFLDYHKLDPETTVMVEDKPKYMKSAKENGMKTIFVREGGDIPHQDIEKYPYADCIVGDVNQVLDLLSKANSRDMGNNIYNLYSDIKGMVK